MMVVVIPQDQSMISHKLDMRQQRSVGVVEKVMMVVEMKKRRMYSMMLLLL